MPTPDSSAWSTEALAEDALLLRFGNAIESALNARVHAAAQRLRRALPGVECVPAYASLLLRFDPCNWPAADGRGAHQRLSEAVTTALQNEAAQAETPREMEIPVWYGDEAGPDLKEVAALCKLSADEVVARHCAGEYRVAMLGFAPGFPYLLGLDVALAVPRRADPRLKVPAGSVAIGGSQTGIYPGELPGGWQLIGRTPLRLFDAHAAAPSLLQAGDRVRFRAIDGGAYRELLESAQR